MRMDTLQQLNDTLIKRKLDDPSTSYVASLYQGGVNKVAQKVGEEATEVVIAAKDAAADAEQKPALISEVADLWFHSLVLLSHLDLSADDVLQELHSASVSAVTPKKPIARRIKRRYNTLLNCLNPRWRRTMFGGFGMTELLVILAIVLLIFGPKRIKSIGSDLGSAIKGFVKQ